MAAEHARRRPSLSDAVVWRGSGIRRPARPCCGRALSASSSTRSISASEKPVSVDVEVEIDQRLQLDRQDLLVPAGIQRELVVGQDIGAALLGRQMRQPQRRHRLQAESWRRARGRGRR